MKKFLKDTRWLICVGTFLTITLLAVSVMAAKITPEDKLRKAEELSIKASKMATPDPSMVPMVRVNLATATFLRRSPKTGNLRYIRSSASRPLSVAVNRL